MGWFHYNVIQLGRVNYYELKYFPMLHFLYRYEVEFGKYLLDQKDTTYSQDHLLTVAFVVEVLNK